MQEIAAGGGWRMGVGGATALIGGCAAAGMGRS
jgi:hypothetical protein